MLSNGRDTHTKYKFAPLDQQGAFFFPTDEGCYYVVEISEGGFKLWNSERLSNDDKVFELSFDSKCDDVDPGLDSSILNTIVHIIGTNIASNGDTCVYYHFGEPDEEKRKTFYESWYDDLKNYIPDFEMYEFQALDDETDNLKYFISLFIHHNHPDKELIMSEFERVMED